jgi:P27 family predicted phage terminase small subunit
MPANRVPTNLLKLRGAFDKHPERLRARQNELTLTVEAPEPPDFLSAHARPHWDQISDTLYRFGVLTKLDVHALAAYCEVYARWLDANSHLCREGCVVPDADGLPRPSPYLRVANDAFQQMRSLLVEFGLTPASRSKVNAPSQEAENPFAAIERMRHADK